MNFSQFFLVLRARWKVAALVLGLTVLTTLVLSLLLPKQYTATASVVIDAKPDPLSTMAYGQLATAAYMATQVDIIQSDRVAQRVVRNLKLAENPQIRQQWQDDTGGQGSVELWLSDTFKKKLDVRPSRESNVISVSYQAQDPRFAAALANAFVQAYLDTSLELRVDPARQYTSFFEVRSKDARETLEKAQTKLSDFQKEKGIIAADERLDVETSRLNELSSQYVGLQSLASDSVSRQTAARGAGADRMQEVLTNPLIAGLKADQTRAEAKLQELSTRLGDKNPQVIEARANLAELKTRIDIEVGKVTSSLGISNNVNQQRAGEIKAQLEAQRAKVLQMKALRDDASVLVRDVENAQRAYDAVVARYNMTALESQTTQSNINVLTQAVPPNDASSPKVVLNTILSLILGSLLAAGVVLLMEMRDRRVRGFDDITQGLGLPLLGVVLKPNAGGSKATKALLLAQQRIVAGPVLSSK